MASFKDICPFAPPFLHLPLTQAYDARRAALPVGGTQESNFAEHEVSQPAKIQLG